MDEWHAVDIVSEALGARHTACVTPEGAAWLASASAFPRSVEALWSARPAAPSVLPCGTAFDVVDLAPLFGRRVLERLWASGTGSGPVAVHRGRVLLFAAPGTARRLPWLLGWEEWAPPVPPMLCHGPGDAVTVPPLYGTGGAPAHPGSPAAHPGSAAARDEGPGHTGRGCDGMPGPEGSASRWVVAPDTRHPWLPGADVLLWACVRAARTSPVGH